MKKRPQNRKNGGENYENLAENDIGASQI